MKAALFLSITDKNIWRIKKTLQMAVICMVFHGIFFSQKKNYNSNYKRKKKKVCWVI